MGYLLGFLAALFLRKFNYDNNLLKTFLKLIICNKFYLYFRNAWLGNLIGWDKPIFKLGAQPFLIS